MHSTTVAVDLAKNVFELAVADSEGKIGERLRLNRARFFSSFFVHRAPCRMLMEACGSAHYWARWIGAHGHAVQLLPAQYVRQYVRRNKTDRADAAALIEAARCTAIRAVPAKSLEQQQVLVLHRLRSQWMSTPTVWHASSGPLGNTQEPSTVTGAARRSDRPPFLPSAKLLQIPTHDQRIGPRRGKAANNRGPRYSLNGWLHAGGSHDVQSRFTHAAHLQDEYPTATVSAAHRSGLDGGVHTRLLEGEPRRAINGRRLAI
jgi:Transposase